MITSNYHILFAVFGIIYGYYFSRNVDFLIKQCDNKNSHILRWIIVVTFFIGIWQINGFRFWTAAQIFTYGIITIFYKNKTVKGTLILIFSVAMHYSFIIPLAIVPVIKILPKWYILFLFLYIISTFITPDLNLSEINQSINNLTENITIQNKVNLYTSDDTVWKISQFQDRSKIRTIISIFNKLIFATILYITFKQQRKQEFHSYYTIMFFGLILAIIGNFLSFIPSMPRFASVGNFILLIGSIAICSNSILSKRQSQYLRISAIIVILLILLQLPWIIFTFSIHTVLGNYFTVLFDQREFLYSFGNLIQDIYRLLL